MHCRETADPIEMSFGLWNRVVLMNIVLGGGPDVRRGIISRPPHCKVGLCREYGVTAQNVHRAQYVRWPDLSDKTASYMSDVSADYVQ